MYMCHGSAWSCGSSYPCMVVRYHLAASSHDSGATFHPNPSMVAELVTIDSDKSLMKIPAEDCVSLRQYHLADKHAVVVVSHVSRWLTNRFCVQRPVHPIVDGCAKVEQGGQRGNSKVKSNQINCC